MLTDAKCKAAKAAEKVYRLADSHGLCLEVRPNGSRFWRYRFRLADKAGLATLGRYPEVSLAEARKARDVAREQVRQGVNPNHHKQLERITRTRELGMTFEAVALEWIERMVSDWSVSYLRQVTRRLKADAFPMLGKLPIADIKAAHVLAALRKVEKRSPTQAGLLKTWIGGVFRYAVTELLREDDPTFPLRRSVKKTQVNHHAILSDKEIGGFLRAIDDAVGDLTVKSAAALMWLTASRSNEVIGARWSEVDLEAMTWTIAPERMKARQQHVIPLTDQAADVFRRMKPCSGTLEHVFPHRSDRKRGMSAEALRDLFKRAGYTDRFTPHGARGTFSTAANGAGWRHDVVELCLAHQDRNPIRRAYNHALLLEERRELLEWWADLSDQARATTTVVLFKRVAA